jgi:hypothetical protein
VAVSGERVAEIPGFGTDLPQSAYLAHTIRRALSAAQQRSHRYVTLEHLLLALLDDPDALALMEVARTDVAALRGAITDTVNHNLATLYTPGVFEPRASYKVERALQSASDDARRMGCAEVDGAFAAVALFHETDSPAYELLKRHNFVFHAANSWITRNRGARAAAAPVSAPPPPPRPAPPPRAAQPAPAASPPRSAPPAAAPPPPLAPPLPPAQPTAVAMGRAQPIVEPDAEILLDEVEVVEDEEQDEQDLTPRRPADPVVVEATLPPYLRERPAPRETPPSGPAPRPAPREAESREAKPQPPQPLPPRQPSPAASRPAAKEPAPGPRQPSPAPSRPTAEAPSRPAPPPPPSPDLGATVPARELSPARDLAPVPAQRNAAEPANRQPDRRRTEARPAAEPTFEAPRAEPRLTTQPATTRGPGGVPAPARSLPGSREGHGLEPRFDHPKPPPAQDLGATVPTRDRSGPAGYAGAEESFASEPPSFLRDKARPSAPAASETAAPGGAASGPSRAPTPPERREPPRPAPASPSPPRPEAAVPPTGRLDDMRVRQSPVVPPAPPAPAPAAPVAAGPAKKSEKTRRRRPPSPAAVYAGKLAENIPRKMRAFKTELIEVRITREETSGVLSGMDTGGVEAFRHDLLITQAMSVMLRAPDGGFVIETLGPETQWIFNNPGLSEKEPFGRWRWSVTPNETGKLRLQLVVAARSVDQNGLAGDTAMPDQVIEVRVRTNYMRSIGQGLKWIILMAMGGAITEGTLMLLKLLGKGN